MLLPLVLALVALLFALPDAHAQRRPQPQPVQQPAPQVEIPGDGTELFRALLDLRGIKPVKLHEVFNHPPGEVIVIVLGDPGTNWNVNALGQAQTVLGGGGSALVAADTFLSLNTFNGFNAAAIQGSRVECEDRESILSVKTAWGGTDWQPECPFVVPATPRTNPFAPRAQTPLAGVFDGLTRVAANSGSYIQAAAHRGHMTHALAAFPRNSKTVFRQNEFQPPLTHDLPPDALFAVGGDGGEFGGFRFLALAGHGVFINQMMITPGTQNWELAFRVIDYLGASTSQGEGPQRKRVATRNKCLFIENGRVVEKFDGLRQAFAPPKPPLPMPDLTNLQEKLTDFANSAIDYVETNDWLNRILLRWIGLPSLLKFFLILLTIYATWFLLRRMVAYRKPTDLPPPPAVAGVPSGPPGVFDRRQKELIRRNNLYEPVRDLVREFFASIGVHGEPGPRPPKVVISDAVRRPESLRLAVRDFWRLAFGAPQEVTASRWREMEPYFERLREAHADGKWRFVTEEAHVGAE